MSTRNKILQAISANKPPLTALPWIDTNQVIHYEDLTAQFKTILEAIGGMIIEVNDLNVIKDSILKEQSEGHYIINTVAALGAVPENLSGLSAHDLASVHKAYIQGTLGVAENGAIWLYEHQMINRLLPFICQHLVLILNKKDLVATLHEAYKQINIARDGYGVFLAGPSKTADIEQSLVIGAHGARSLVVYLI